MPEDGIQEIGPGDVEVLTVDDPGGVAAPDEPVEPAKPVSEPADAFSEAFGGDTETETEPGVTDQADGDGIDTAAPTPPATPVEPERPDWLPAEIDPAGLSDAELLRLQVVHQSATAAQQLPPQEAALLERYRQASASLGGQANEHPQPPAPQAYQPQVLETPDGYEDDTAIKGLVDSINRQNAENAYLLNQQSQQMTALQASVQNTSQQTAEQGRVAAWNSFLVEHPEAKEADVQQKIAEQIQFWSDPSKDPRQFWAQALLNIVPKEAPAKAEKSAPLDPAATRARAKRAMATSAVNPPAQTLEPAERSAALDTLHEKNADFGAFFRAEFPNG